MLDKLPTMISFIQSYPLWVQFYAAICTLMIAALIPLFIIVPRTDESAPLERSPSFSAERDTVDGNPAMGELLFAESLDQLRQNNQVRELRNSENDLPLARLPRGVFGWVNASELNTLPIRLSSEPVAEVRAVSLFRENQTGRVEIHKPFEGEAYLVVFVSEEMRRVLEDPSRARPTDVTVAFMPNHERPHVVGMRYERVTFWRTRSLADGHTLADCRIQ